ncbi:hypothetical protein Tco_0737567 [Tanacetum coccineum]
MRAKGCLLEEEENEEVEEEASKDETKIQVDAELTQDIGWLLPIFLRAHAEPWRIFLEIGLCLVLVLNLDCLVLVLNLDILALASLVVRLI